MKIPRTKATKINFMDHAPALGVKQLDAKGHLSGLNHLMKQRRELKINESMTIQVPVS